MTQIGYTSLEQARALLGLGLMPETADMHFFIDESVKVDMRYSKEAEECYKNTSLEYLPCWSLSALLEVIRKNNPNEEIMLFGGKKEGYKLCCGVRYNTKAYDLAVDAAVEAVVELIDKGYVTE